MDYHTLYHSKLRKDLTESEIIFKDCLYYVYKNSQVLYFDPKVYLRFFHATGILAEEPHPKHPIISNADEIRKHYFTVKELYQRLLKSNPDWHKIFSLTLKGGSGLGNYAEELFDRLYPESRKYCNVVKPLE